MHSPVMDAIKLSGASSQTKSLALLSQVQHLPLTAKWAQNKTLGLQDLHLPGVFHFTNTKVLDEDGIQISTKGIRQIFEGSLPDVVIMLFIKSNHLRFFSSGSSNGSCDVVYQMHAASVYGERANFDAPTKIFKVSGLREQLFLHVDARAGGQNDCSAKQYVRTLRYCTYTVRHNINT